MFHLRGVRTLVRHRRASAVVFSMALFCAVWASTWRPTAQNQNLPRPNAVERLDAAAPARPLNPADRGATYRWLDERAVRVTTTFVDAVVVTERIPGGDLRTRIRDTAGRELGEFAVDRVGAGDDVLTFKRGGEQVVRAAGKPNGPLTLDWSNRQAYAIWKDDPANPAIPLEWQGDVIRARGGRSLRLPAQHARSANRVARRFLGEGHAGRWTAARPENRRPEPRIVLREPTGARQRGSRTQPLVSGRAGLRVVHARAHDGLPRCRADERRGRMDFHAGSRVGQRPDLCVSLLSHVDGDARIRRRRGASGQ